MERMFLAVFATAIFVTATTSEAARRPTVDSLDACTNRSTDKGCGGLICYCCYTDGPDSEKGCWICDQNFHNCTWDPKMAAMTPGSPPRSIAPMGTAPTVSPNPKTQPQRLPGQIQRRGVEGEESTTVPTEQEEKAAGTPK